MKLGLPSSSQPGGGYFGESKMRRHTHGLAGSVTYRSWHDMRQRCNNPNDKQYPDYGGRGITVCKRWRIFTNFLADMGEMPSGHSIDRVDNDAGYCKENCRWATRTEQNRNTRRNVTLTYQGKTLCIAGWGELLGVNYRTLLSRVNAGWAVEDALTKPTRGTLR